MADQHDDINSGDVEDDEEQARSQPQFKAPAADDDNDGDESGEMTMPPVGRKLSAQEKKLKKFAGRIVLVEKIGNQVKGMTCAWASFVLLGAFSNNLAMRDFWFATIILLQARIIPFSYMYVVTDWRRTSSNNSHPFWSSSCLRLFSFRRGWIVIVYLMELSAAILLLYITIVVPAEVLVNKEQDQNKSIARNKKYSLVLFYCLIIIESTLFLVGNMYYFGKVILQGAFQKISMELGFDDLIIPVQGFFIDCLSSSDDDRDMVTFGVDLLASDMQDKQLVGVRILSTFVRNKPNDFSRKVLINIGANLKALERLVNILDNCSSVSYDDDDDEEFYTTWESTATILSKLTTVEQNGFRVYQIPGSIQIICSHLLDHKGKLGSNWNTTRRLASEILANLARDEDAKDVIGRIRSGGVVKKLLKIFFKKGTNSDSAGNAIVMLTFHGESNCKLILKLNLLKRFIKAALLELELDDDVISPVFGLHAKKILSNLCMYSGASSDDHLVIPIIQAAPTVFKMIVDEGTSSEKGKEIIVGIASYICKSKTLERSSVVEFGVEEDRLAAELVAMLIKCKDGDPIIARSVIEVATWMMTNSPVMVHTFIEKDLVSILKGISDTADEEESDDFELQFLVDTALEILLKPTTS